MKQDPLARLFVAAARGTREESAELSPFVEERIIRALSKVEREPSIIPVFRLGFAVSMGVACLMVALTAQANDNSNPFEEVSPTVDVATLAYYP